MWPHPAAFDAAAVVDRVRGEFQAAAGVQIDSGVVRVWLEPVARTTPCTTGRRCSARERTSGRTTPRVQAMLGADGAATAVVGGGRRLAERQVLVPWGERAVPPLAADRPWPGHLTAPLPATLFADLRRMAVLAGDGTGVTVDDRGFVSAPPALLIDEKPGAARSWRGRGRGRWTNAPGTPPAGAAPTGSR